MFVLLNWHCNTFNFHLVTLKYGQVIAYQRIKMYRKLQITSDESGRGCLVAGGWLRGVFTCEKSGLYWFHLKKFCILEK